MNVHAKNGLNPNRAGLDRDSITSQPKEHKMEHPKVNMVSRGLRDNVMLSTHEVKQLSKIYNFEVQPGVKSIGNSTVKIKIHPDLSGELYSKE